MKRRFFKGTALLSCFLLASLAPLASSSAADSEPAASESSGLCADQARQFIPNIFWTTPYGPAYADILLQGENFVPCKGGPFALCYYSGPEPLSCTPTGDGLFANCKCYEISYGVYYVDINAILNLNVYLKTVHKCLADGSLCTATNSAPVCQAINQGTLIPGADFISTFSFDCVPTNGIGQSNCSSALYAGCMTAPCYKTDELGIVECKCPLYSGPFQVGELDAQCGLPLSQVWSAAYNPGEGGTTFPQPPTCVPDAAGSVGCPLYVPSVTTLPPDSGVDCAEVCNEYASCQSSNGIGIGFTCDATLCTASCSDRDLVSLACAGLKDCDVSEIIKAEQAAQCSCCASQLCGCEPNPLTNEAIGRFNQIQSDRGIESQCAQNGTLCGS